MDSMIKEINENLKAIIDNLKDNVDSSINTLDNIQIQMDKKVEEAKKYKIQVDSAKERIKVLEDENRSLELSLNELSDKYGKMNLVSLVEAGNREIKAKINDNLKEINKEKTHIADLTNKARTIKDLLINLKKDKTIKETRLENSKIIFEYYNDKLNEIIDYAFNHSENLSDYKNVVKYIEEDEEEIQNVELENTMVFDEIANIDENKTFKDEMSFVDEQIDNVVNDDFGLSKIDEIIKQSLENIDEDIEESEENIEPVEDIDSTQVFDSIINENLEESEEVTNEFISNELDSFKVLEEDEVVVEDNSELTNDDLISHFEIGEHKVEESEEETSETDGAFNLNVEEPLKVEDSLALNIKEPEEVKTEKTEELNIDSFNNFNINGIEENVQNEDEVIDAENEERINKINDLFANFENTVSIDNVNKVSSIEDKIDDAYMDVFGKPIDSDDLNQKIPTLTDIFGNPVSKDELSNETKIGKKLEELFVENGIDFNKFREDEKNYLKQIYDEDKFNSVLNVLKKNRINLDNIYNAFNIFGEISSEELDELITNLLSIGQSVEAIGLVLEKLPKVKKYNLNDAIMSYGEYIKNIDITELIMKAKELYKDGGNN